MRRLPTGTDRDEFHALVVRTDHDSEQAWQAVIAKLMQPWGDRDYEPLVHFVDDPAWAGATVDEVLVAAAADEDLCVVFVADSVTMGSAHHGLLAVTTVPAEEYENLEEYEELRALGREFRTVPAGVHDIHANLSIANLDFEDFAAAAREAPDRVFRSL
ncbi:DUF6924 domain-containing protein [Streptomyces xanthophaeus]